MLSVLFRNLEKTKKILALVQNNPLTKLANNYGSKIVSKITEHFYSDEQQLFVANFYSYLNYNTREDKVIELDKIWKWIGFSQKIRAKELLINHFEEGKDYIFSIESEKILLSLERKQKLNQLMDQKKIQEVVNIKKIRNYQVMQYEHVFSYSFEII